MFELRQLRALDALAQQGSIAAAARMLHCSQPTVTHHLAELGKLIGAPIIASNSRGSTLTAEGHTLLPYAQEILALSIRAQRDVAQAHTRNHLSIGVLPSMGARLMPRVITTLRAAGITVDVREAETDELIQLMHALIIDAAIVMGGRELEARLPPRTILRPLFVEPLVVIVPASHKLANRQKIPLSELTAENWILSNTANDPIDQALTLAAERDRFTIHATLRSDDYSVIHSYVAAGLGIALVPESGLTSTRQDVRPIHINDHEFTRELSVVVGLQLPLSVAETFLQQLARASA